MEANVAPEAESTQSVVFIVSVTTISGPGELGSSSAIAGNVKELLVLVPEGGFMTGELKAPTLWFTIGKLPEPEGPVQIAGLVER